MPTFPDVTRLRQNIYTDDGTLVGLRSQSNLVGLSPDFTLKYLFPPFNTRRTPYPCGYFRKRSTALRLRVSLAQPLLAESPPLLAGVRPSVRRQMALVGVLIRQLTQ